MREKLIELVGNMRRKITAWHTAEDIADMLIANDVVPVVRCKDCIYNEKASCMFSSFCNPHYRPEYFCADGERKDNG